MSRCPTPSEGLWLWLVVGVLPISLFAAMVLHAFGVSVIWAPIAGPGLLALMWGGMVGGNHLCGFKDKHWGAK